MAFKPLRCVKISCGEVVFSDVTGLYDEEFNPTGYGTPNPAYGDTAPYALTFYKPKSLNPSFGLDLNADIPEIDGDEAYNYTITKADLGYGPDENIVSGLWRVGVTFGTDKSFLYVFSTGDIWKKITKCVCGDPSKAVLELSLTAAKRLFCCGKTNEAQEMIEQLYHDTACCCGC